MENNPKDTTKNITPLSRDEQETALNWFATDKTININTAESSMIHLLDKYVREYPDHFKCTHVDELHRYKNYTIARKCLKITPPRAEAQIAAAKRNIAHVNNKN